LDVDIETETVDKVVRARNVRFRAVSPQNDTVIVGVAKDDEVAVLIGRHHRRHAVYGDKTFGGVETQRRRILLHMHRARVTDVHVLRCKVIRFFAIGGDGRQ